METIKRLYNVFVRQLPLRIVALLALGLLVGLSLIRGCRAPAQPLNDEPLEVLRVDVSPSRHVTVRTDSGESQTLYVPQDGSANVGVDKTGAIFVNVNQAGIGFKPGLSMIITDRLRIGADVQLAYWNRLELHAGVAGPRIVGYVGLGHRLDAIGLSNTTAQVVYTTDKHVGAALSVRF